VDKTIKFIQSNKNSQQPFFANVPFQVVHIPVQAPQKFTDKYMDSYLSVWHDLRLKRQASAKALGLVPQDSEMVSMSIDADWESQTDKIKRYQAKLMAVYAGMLDAMDHHIGRLVKHLKSTGQYDNTVFIFSSDNGSLGLKGSMNTIGPSFASASASPLAFYKFYAGEGGMRVPLIISGNPLNINKQTSNAFSFVTDITPTILQITNIDTTSLDTAGISSSQDKTQTFDPAKIIGRSLLPIITKQADRVYQPEDAVGYELAGNSVLFQGDYKLVKNTGRIGDDQWRLFNIVKDPGETQDLSLQDNSRYKVMLDLYKEYAKANQVLAMPEGYDHERQGIMNGIRLRFEGKGTPILFIFTILVIILIWQFKWRK
jgi:arylsulfatase A-like enzyme